MAPINESTTGNDPAFDKFVATLSAFHEKRGTHFDPHPRVGSKTIDLLRLFNKVVERGGYDVVSDEKLRWRAFGTEFGLGQQNAPALAFALKSVYYKNLVAYEISTVHGKEPPPKEILEDQTARGSGVLTRTLENYRPTIRREATALNPESEASGDDGTPARERHGSEEAPGSGGRATRGLRQAPPQRVLFQPETQSTRQHKNTSTPSNMNPNQHQHHMPQHHQPQQQHQSAPRGASTSYNPSNNIENMSPAVTNYEPRPQMPLTLRQVITPGNNPAEFARRQRALALAQTNGKPTASPPKLMLPGSESQSITVHSSAEFMLIFRSGV